MQSPTHANLPRAVWDSGRMLELHPTIYVLAWVILSNITIIFNKWLLDTAGFRYPIILTTLHLSVATVLTQLLARFSPLLNSRYTIKLTGRIYLRAILPIGILYTLSLLFSNLTYLYLSVSFIQMLKALAPVSTLFLSFFLGLSNPKVSILYSVLVIAFGVVLSSLGEVKFSWIGFGFQMGGTVAESLRLLMIQALLSTRDGEGEGGGNGVGMDPLVGLYYYAPVCAVLNGIVALVIEAPDFNWEDLDRVGWEVLGLNGFIAFMLNVASVFLIGKTSALAMNLTGILKSILLVAASMAIWHTPITALQAFGYGIALLGMAYYSMGAEATRSYIEKFKSWLRSDSNSSSTNSDRRSWLRAWVQSGRELNPEDGLSSILSAPRDRYSSVPSSDESSTNQDIGDIEAGKKEVEAPQRDKLGIKQG